MLDFALVRFASDPRRTMNKRTANVRGVRDNFLNMSTLARTDTPPNDRSTPPQPTRPGQQVPRFLLMQELPS